MRRMIFLLAVLGALILAGGVLAQSSASFRLERTVIAGGGGRSTSASYQLEGTLGQSIASPPASFSGSYGLWSGFWPGLYRISQPLHRLFHLPISIR
jgi:hypothetical protein